MGHKKALEFCEVLDSYKIPYLYNIRHKEIKGCDESALIYQRYAYLLENFINCRHVVLREKNGERRIFLLVVAANQGNIDLQQLRVILDSKKLMFLEPDVLGEVLKTGPGNVSLFHLIYDKDNTVQTIIDQELIGDVPLVFHPLYNGNSVFLNMTAILQFLDIIGHSYEFMNIPRKKEDNSRKLLNY